MSRRLYIFKSGRLSRKQNTIFIEQEDGTKNYIPIENVSEIHCFGNLDFNKDALEFLTQNGIPLHLYNHYEYYIGTYYPREHLESGELILQQVEYYKDDIKRLDLAKRFVQGSIENMLAIISYYKNRGKDLFEIETELKEFLLKIYKVENVEALMGLEGNSRNAYYSTFDKIIENKDFPFLNRTRQPPSNEVNALISFGNSIIYSTVLSEIYKTHLDPRIGYLHTTNFRRFSLNLDVAEIFKPIIIDRSIFSLINKKIITKNDFSPHLQGIYMNEGGKKKFVEEIENQLSTTISHLKMKKKVSYKYLIRLELYKLEKHFLGDKEYTPYISKW